MSSVATNLRVDEDHCFQGDWANYSRPADAMLMARIEAIAKIAFPAERTTRLDFQRQLKKKEQFVATRWRHVQKLCRRCFLRPEHLDAI